MAGHPIEKRREYFQNAYKKHGDDLWKQQVLYRARKNARIPTPSPKVIERYGITGEDLKPIIEAIQRAYGIPCV